MAGKEKLGIVSLIYFAGSCDERWRLFLFLNKSKVSDEDAVSFFCMASKPSTTQYERFFPIFDLLIPDSSL